MEQRVLGERYLVQEKIGTGGSAHVYRATDRLLGRMVAVKVLHEHTSADPAFVERFRREARSAAALNHPNIVSIYDTGEIGDVNYIVMEYVGGSNLKDVIRSGPLQEREVLDIAIQVADALQAAHDNGLIHRDIKPHNVLLTPGGRAKVVDFGIARAQGLTQLTQTNAVHGTAHYISPEQARGQVVDARSDEYSLAVVLYEMLTGREPFRGESLVEVALHHIHDQPIPPRVLRPDISPATESIVLKALAKEPGDRFASMREMSTALLAARKELEQNLEKTLATTIAPITSTTSDVGVLPNVGHIRTRASRDASSPQAQRQTATWLWLAPLMLATLVGGVAFAAFGRSGAAHNVPKNSHRVAIGTHMGQPTARPTAPIHNKPGHGTVGAVLRPAPSPSPTTVNAAPTPVNSPVARQSPAMLAANGSRFAGNALQSPAQAVRRFYMNIKRGDLAGAAGLWTAAMRNKCDPNPCIFQRFANTSIQVENIGPVLQDSAAGTATVPVLLREYRNSSSAFTTISGNWYLVRTSSGWMLNNEDLAAS